MGIEIKPLVNAHCKGFIDLVLPIQQIEFNVPIRLDDQPDMLDIETYYRASGGGIWGAFDQDRLVGTIALISTGHQAGVIRKMFVHREYRGKELGIAKQLLQILIAYCEQNKITDLYLGTIEIFNAALRFYEKNGFQRINKADLPSFVPLMELDNAFYHTHL